jgi:Spy/CpxP family protein refolding chaperone
MKLRRARVSMAAFLGALALVAPLSGQGVPPGGRPGGPDRAQLEQRIRAQMGRMTRQRLGLDDEQAAKLSDVVQDFDGRRRALLSEEQDTRQRVDSLLRNTPDDQAQAKDLLDSMADLRMREAQLFRDEQTALLGVLTPPQVLQLQILRQDIGRRIRALRGGGGPDGGRRPGRPPGPRPGGGPAGDARGLSSPGTPR